MSTTRVTAVFDDDHHLLEATRACRAAGVEIVDAFTPFAVHGLDEAMGLRRSRLSVACFLFGLTGMVAALAFQVWVSTLDWPMNVGGKSFLALPALMPVTFEVTILFAALGTVLVCLIRMGLFPGKQVELPADNVTNDRFALVLRSAADRLDDLRTVLRRHHATSLSEQPEVCS